MSDHADDERTRELDVIHLESASLSAKTDIRQALLFILMKYVVTAQA